MVRRGTHAARQGAGTDEGVQGAFKRGPGVSDRASVAVCPDSIAGQWDQCGGCAGREVGQAAEFG